MIEGLTDNKNRTAAEVRHLLSSNGSALAASGSAIWAFEKQDDGWVAKTTVPISESDKDSVAKVVESLEDMDDVQNVYTNSV